MTSSEHPRQEMEIRRVGTLRIRLQLPPGFPAKYRPAILRAVDLCAVKRHILDPPEFDLALAEPAPRP